jgi:hypothetical protein
MASEAVHRRQMESASLDLDRVQIQGEHAIQRRGQWFGLIISVSVKGGGLIVSAINPDAINWAGLSGVVLGMSGLIASMVLNRTPRGDKPAP